MEWQCERCGTKITGVITFNELGIKALCPNCKVMVNVVRVAENEAKTSKKRRAK